ncbi:MAG: hypothetical protein AAFN92_06680 [Bacteroidota bacterium]
MRTFLFLDTVTTGPDTETDRIVQLNTRLANGRGFYDKNLLAQPANAATIAYRPADSAPTQDDHSVSPLLAALELLLQNADIIVGHQIDLQLAFIIAEATRTGRNGMVATLTHPKFGLRGGQRAAICTRRLAADYLRYLGKYSSPADTQLPGIYRRLFHQRVPDITGAVACHQLYGFFRDFQLSRKIDFVSDIVCLPD